MAQRGRPKKIKVEVPLVEPEVKLEKVSPVLPSGHQALPLEYRDIIDKLLNKTFGASMLPRTDGYFELHISVPDKYSTVSPEHKKLSGGDLRVKVVAFADGVNGVREYTEKVYNNFSDEIKSLILVDKQNA